MRSESAMLERWFFYQDAASLWKWARLDVLGTVLGHSGSSFETREACVEHALLHGYHEVEEPSRSNVASLSERAGRIRPPPANRPL